LMQDRIAILDIPDGTDLTQQPQPGSNLPFPYPETSYAAAYYPWIDVATLPLTPATSPPLAATLRLPPSGHIAGLYARVDGQRGVHKAPANEVLFNALDVTTPIPQSVQDNVNPFGVNIIKVLNGNVKLWGARTLGGKDNILPAGDFKYIHVRRLFNFIRTSIMQGTQWTVFEPNTPALWAKVTRNVSAFLRGLWEQGALFGTTPEQAFYVKCDEETNPPDRRAVGEMHAEIGVNITSTAEFVIFTIGQWQPPAK
jgi:phage tail sheath protein FI